MLLYFHVEDGAVLSPVPGKVRRVAAVRSKGHGRVETADVVRCAQVGQRHLRELFERIPILSDRGVVDLENGRRRGIEHAHGTRIVPEEQAVALLAGGKGCLGLIASPRIEAGLPPKYDKA